MSFFGVTVSIVGYGFHEQMLPAQSVYLLQEKEDVVAAFQFGNMAEGLSKAAFVYM